MSSPHNLFLVGAEGNHTSSLTHDEATSLDYLLVCLCIVFVLLTAHATHLLHWSWLSETGAIIMLGIIVGGIFRLIDYATDDDNHSFSFIATVKFQHDIFLNVILPLIILEAGYSLKHSGIVRNLGAVLLLAIPGTLLSTLIIGGIVYGWSGFSLPELFHASGGLMLCFTFGSLLSATDPVSVIALLSSQFDLSKEPPLLYNLIFGESVLNDAVAIVLFDVFIAYIKEPLSGGSVILALLNFAKIFCLSSIIGYVMGLLLAILFKYVNFHDVHHIEVSLMGLFAAAAYYLADLLDLSGIMSLFVASRTIGHHASYNMSRTARETAPFVFKTLAAISECAVFFLLGTALWAYSGVYNASMITGVILACLISRFFVVIPFCGLSNLKRNLEIITGRMQLFMWYSGLRGAIAFGLVVILHGKAETGELGSSITSEITSVLLSATLCTILFTVLLMGAGAGSLLRFLELDKPVEDEVLLSRLKAQEILRQLEEPLPELRGLGWFIRRVEKRFIEGIVRRQPDDYIEKGEHSASRYGSMSANVSRKSRRKSTKTGRRHGQESDLALLAGGASNGNSAAGYGAIDGSDEDPSSANFFLTRRTHNEWGSVTAGRSSKAFIQNRSGGGGEATTSGRLAASFRRLTSGGGGGVGSNNNSSKYKPNQNDQEAEGQTLSESRLPGTSNTAGNSLAAPQNQLPGNSQNYLSATISGNNNNNNASNRRLSSRNHHHHSSRHSTANAGWQDAVRESRHNARQSVTFATSNSPQQAGSPTAGTSLAAGGGATISSPTLSTGYLGEGGTRGTGTGQSLTPAQQEAQAAAAAAAAAHVGGVVGVPGQPQSAANGQQQQQIADDDDSYSGSSSDDEDFYEYNPQRRPYEFSRLF